MQDACTCSASPAAYVQALQDVYLSRKGVSVGLCPQQLEVLCSAGPCIERHATRGNHCIANQYEPGRAGVPCMCIKSPPQGCACAVSTACMYACSLLVRWHKSFEHLRSPCFMPVGCMGRGFLPQVFMVGNCSFIISCVISRMHLWHT